MFTIRGKETENEKENLAGNDLSGTVYNIDENIDTIYLRNGG